MGNKREAVSDKYDYLIIGAGLYGAVMARELTDRGRSVLVLEKRDHIAGNCYTGVTDGLVVHKYGPHIFHTDDERVWEYVNRFASFNRFSNRPATVSGNKTYSLPFNMDTFYQLWGVSDPAEAERIIDKQAADHLKGKEPENLEEQAISMAGTDIYEKLIKGYSEKQWGRECRELPASIIRRLRISFDHNSDYYGEKYQGIPKDGYTRMIANMLKGIDVLTGVDYDDADVRSQAETLAGKVIYTGSIDRYYSYCFGRLEYRSVRFEELRVEESQCYQDRAVVNYADNEVLYTRITEHRHFDPEKIGADLKFTIISREFPEEHNDGNEPMYPIRDEKNLKLYQEYRKLADKDTELFFGGRLGTYRYMDMDDVVASALEDAERLIQK